MNINQWYLVAQEYMSNYGGNNGYVRAYARYTQQDTENVRSYVETQCRFYVEQYYVTSGKPTGGSISCTDLGTSASGDAGGRYNAGETVIASSGGWVSHDAEGNKTINVSANMGRELNEKLNYTNEEQFIGYYNGDRLYRKRITGIFDQRYASSYWANISITGTKTLVNFGGAIYDTADATGNSFNASSGTRMVRIPSGTLRLDLTNTSFVNKYFDCWVEYTRN